MAGHAVAAFGELKIKITKLYLLYMFDPFGVKTRGQGPYSGAIKPASFNTSSIDIDQLSYL